MLLAEINKRRAVQAQLDMELAETSYTIADICQFSLSDSLYIDATAMSSLQILHRETHPNAQAWNSSSSGANNKEGLSVYGIFRTLASTSQGKTNLLKFFLRPTRHFPTLTDRHETITTLLRPQNSEIIKQITRTLKKVPNIKRDLLKLSKGIDSTSTRHGLWAAIGRFCSSLADLQRLTASLSGCQSTLLLSQASPYCAYLIVLC